MASTATLRFPARATDPLSSFRAAAALKRSGALSQQRAEVMALVSAHPGFSSRGLAHTTGSDRYVLARRLPELETLGLVRREKIGGDDCRWYPAEMAAQHETTWRFCKTLFQMRAFDPLQTWLV